MLSVLIDMNLSPEWVPLLEGAGLRACHWSAVGDPRAADVELMFWAVRHEHIILTHDLDFGTSLALTHARGPSVVQFRIQDILPERAGALILSVLGSYTAELEGGALIVVDERKSRVRVLPF